MEFEIHVTDIQITEKRCFCIKLTTLKSYSLENRFFYYVFQNLCCDILTVFTFVFQFMLVWLFPSLSFSTFPADLRSYIVFVSTVHVLIHAEHNLPLR